MSISRIFRLDRRTRLATAILAILLLELWNADVNVTEFAFRGQGTWTRVIREASAESVARISNVTVSQDDGSTLALLPSLLEGSDTTVTTTYEEKYLLYFSQAGWANQVTCLKNAYIVAHALNRILLLPPVLPHRNEPGSTRAGMVLSREMGKEGFVQIRRAAATTTTTTTTTTSAKKSKKTFDPRNLDPFYHYLERLPSHRYLPLSHVLDINVTLPNVRTMDVRDFYHQHHHPNMTRASIELDYGYSHFNTMWTYNMTKLLEGTSVPNGLEIHGKIQTFNQTYRDLVAAVGTRLSKDEEEEDLLVLLDSFKASCHPSLEERVQWRPRMTQFIRQTVREAVGDSSKEHINKNGWPTNYAAIHIRTGDGPFKYSIDTTIRKVMRDIAPVILDWLNHNHRVSNQTTEYSVVPLSTIGLYVATDLANFHEHPVFMAEATKLTNVVFEEYQVNLTIVSQADSGNSLVELANGGSNAPSTDAATTTKASSTNTTTSLSLPRGETLLYADAFWDIQVCVCAPIGFQGSARSTFSQLIDCHRTANDPC